MSLFPRAVCQLICLFIFNMFNLNFHVLNLNSQPLACSCRSPLCAFQHKDLLLAGVGTKLTTKPCHCSSAPAPCHPQIILLPSNSLTTLQHSCQHRCSQPSSSQQITHIWGYFLVEESEAYTRVHQQSGCVSVFPDSYTMFFCD